MQVPIPTTKSEAQDYAEKLCKVLASAVTATVAGVYKNSGKWYTLLLLSWAAEEGTQIAEVTTSMEIADLVMVADHILLFLKVPNRRMN